MNRVFMTNDDGTVDDATTIQCSALDLQSYHNDVTVFHKLTK